MAGRSRSSRSRPPRAMRRDRRIRARTRRRAGSAQRACGCPRRLPRRGHASRCSAWQLFGRAGAHLKSPHWRATDRAQTRIPGCTLSGTGFGGVVMLSEKRDGGLTARQRDVVARMRSGLTNKEIAGELGISEDGVKAHLSRLYLRYGVTNRVALLRRVDEESPVIDLGRRTLGELRTITGNAHERT